MKKFIVAGIAVILFVAGTGLAEAQAFPALFNRALMRGMTGEDVKDLQALLAQDPVVYPEGLQTGFFGELTEAAVKRFQQKHGIEQAGVFGPKSRARIYWLMSNASSTGSTSTPLFIPPGIAKKIGRIASSTVATSTASSTGQGIGQLTLCHKTGNAKNAKQHSITVGVPGVAAHLAHGDTVGPCGGSTGTTTPSTDTKAPRIGDVSATSTAGTSATVTWDTNETSNSKVWFGTTTPLVVDSSASSVTESALVKSHSVGLSGLSASTTYYYIAVSKDAAGNTATSSQQSFTTL